MDWTRSHPSFLLSFSKKNPRSAIDHLVTLDHLIQKPFKEREHLIGVFFDLKDAYLWHDICAYEFCKRIKNKLRGTLPAHVSSFCMTALFMFVWEMFYRPKGPHKTEYHKSLHSVPHFCVGHQRNGRQLANRCSYVPIRWWPSYCCSGKTIEDITAGYTHRFIKFLKRPICMHFVGFGDPTIIQCYIWTRKCCPRTTKFL